MAVQAGAKKEKKVKKSKSSTAALPSESPAGDAAVHSDAAASSKNEGKTRKKRKQADVTAQAAEAADIHSDQQPADDGAQAAPPQSDAAAAEASPRKAKRRRKKQADEPVDEQLSPEEQARRLHQRERQQLALRLQAAGKPYKRQKRRKPDEPGRLPAPKGAPAAKSAAETAESGSKPDHPVQVIVVPIFWNKRVQEKEAVLAAAEQISSLLSEVGIDTGCDTTTALSPGQKFRAWEMQGVKLRVEVGPKEAEQGSCILSVCSTPGEVAAKTPMQVGQRLLDAVRKQLPDLPPADAAQDSAAVAKLKAPGAGKHVIRQPRGRSNSSISAAPPAKHTHFGGDDLDDDFAAVPQEDEESHRKNKQKKQGAPAVHVPRPAASKQKKASKVVQF